MKLEGDTMEKYDDDFIPAVYADPEQQAAAEQEAQRLMAAEAEHDAEIDRQISQVEHMTDDVESDELKQAQTDQEARQDEAIDAIYTICNGTIQKEIINSFLFIAEIQAVLIDNQIRQGTEKDGSRKPFDTAVKTLCDWLKSTQPADAELSEEVVADSLAKYMTGLTYRMATVPHDQIAQQNQQTKAEATAAKIADAEAIPAEIPEAVQEALSLMNMPSTTLSTLASDAITHIDDLDSFIKQKKSVSPNSLYKVTKNESTVSLSRQKRKNRNTISKDEVILPNVPGVKQHSKAMNDWYIFLLFRINQQAIDKNGKPYKNQISFSLQDMVDCGMYKTLNEARADYNNVIPLLRMMSVSSCNIVKEPETDENGDPEADENGKPKMINSYKYRLKEKTLFTGKEVDNSQIYIDLNPGIVNWKPLTEYIAYLPGYYFRLPGRAQQLLLYICQLARQNKSEIKKHGYFTISYRAIQCELGLPDELKTKNPKRDIKGAIDNAIKNIMDEDSKNPEGYLQLDPLYTSEDKIRINEYLENGYLKVTPKGKMKNRLNVLADKQTTEIANSKAKKDRIQEAAEAKNLADQMKKSKGKITEPST